MPILAPLGGAAPLLLHEACAPLLSRPVTLGLSGGRDSVALLLLLQAAGAQVYAMHVHHGIRGVEADVDAAFCRELCARHEVPLAVAHVDVPALAQACGESLETVARRERRRLLAEHAASLGGVVALAHHADDQAETVLFHLARGAAGLRSMQPVSHMGGVTWIRPLLNCRREQITAWLQSLGQPWREDATNAVPDVTRNALRLQVLPALSAAMGRDVAPILNRSARLQGEVAEALQTALEALPLLDPQGRLYLPFLDGKPLAFRKAVLHYYLHRCGVPDISEKIILAVCDILPADAPAATCNLPGLFRAHRSHKRLSIRRSSF